MTDTDSRDFLNNLPELRYGEIKNDQQKWPSTDDDRRSKANFIDQFWSARGLNLLPFGPEPSAQRN